MRRDGSGHAVVVSSMSRREGRRVIEDDMGHSTGCSEDSVGVCIAALVTQGRCDTSGKLCREYRGWLTNDGKIGRLSWLFGAAKRMWRSQSVAPRGGASGDRTPGALDVGGFLCTSRRSYKSTSW